MDFRKLTSEQRRQILEQEVQNLETQLWQRRRDVTHWQLVTDDPLEAARAVDSRVVNNRNEETKQQLAMALYDCRKLELKLELTAKELDEYEGKADAGKTGDA